MYSVMLNSIHRPDRMLHRHIFFLRSNVERNIFFQPDAVERFIRPEVVPL